MHTVNAERVAEYYDHNTAPFLRWGGSGVDLAAIHRELWGPNVTNSTRAFEYVNRYVLDQLQSGLGDDTASHTVSHIANDMPRARAIDLGCGIGGTCTWLAARSRIHVTGVTLSAVQCEWASERAAQLGLSAHCTFLTADMTATGLREPFDLAYAVESLIHVAEPEAFFAEAARLVRPGGKLVLSDDYLAPNYAVDASRARWIATFERGWRAFGLRTWARTVEVARAHGFTLYHHEDVTAYQRTVSPWLIHLGHNLLRLPFLQSPYWDSLRGSTALQHCTRRGWIGYHLGTFMRGD
jgi:2-polyprenyl-3-methyl-5-hydroxy-6-metoxy-1,4-benzoquinol methylase